MEDAGEGTPLFAVALGELGNGIGLLLEGNERIDNVLWELLVVEHRVEDGSVNKVEAFGKVEVSADQGVAHGLGPLHLEGDLEPLLVRGGACPVRSPFHESSQLGSAPDAVHDGEYPEASLREGGVALALWYKRDVALCDGLRPDFVVLDDLEDFRESLVSYGGKPSEVRRAPAVWSSAGNRVLVVCRVRHILLRQGIGRALLGWIEVCVGREEVQHVCVWSFGVFLEVVG